MKDPLDNGRTAEIPFETSFENIPEVVPLTPVVEEPPEFTPMADEKLKAALAQVRNRSFSGRNKHLGKMIKCSICGHRHRQTNMITLEIRSADGTKARKTIYFDPCKQTFAHIRNGFEYFREDADGKLVPDYRTAVDPDLKPTVRQQNGAPQNRPRKHPHPNSYLLELVERTRKVFTEMGFTIVEGEQAQKNMGIARKEAMRQLHREDRARAKKKRDAAKLSRKINRRRQ